MASATGIPEQNPREEEPLLGRPGDATQLPEQGLQFNFITGTGTEPEAFTVHSSLLDHSHTRTGRCLDPRCSRLGMSKSHNPLAPVLIRSRLPSSRTRSFSSHIIQYDSEFCSLGLR